MAETSSEWSPSAPAWVWRTGIKPGAWRVLMALWSFADHGAKGEIVVYPSVDTVAKMLGIEPRTVRTQVRWLIDRGWAAREPGHKYYVLALRLAWLEPFGWRATDPRNRRNRSAESTQPIREIDATDPGQDAQPIREIDATDPQNRRNRSAKSTQPITQTSQDLPRTSQDPPTSARATGQLGLLGDEHAPVTQTDSACADPVTPARIRAWWTTTYLPIRAEALDAYRPGSAKDIACSDARVTAIRARLDDTCAGLTWTECAERLTHVVKNAAARVHEYKGRKTDWGWQSLDAIQPKHWLFAKNFLNYYESPPMYESEPAVDEVSEVQSWELEDEEMR